VCRSAPTILRPTSFVGLGPIVTGSRWYLFAARARRLGVKGGCAIGREKGDGEFYFVGGECQWMQGGENDDMYEDVAQLCPGEPISRSAR
jgi:hypothetical protein